MIDRPVCRCGKLCYSYRDAQQAIADAKRNNHRRHIKVIPKRSYPCPACGCYHLTSRADYRDRKKLMKGVDF